MPVSIAVQSILRWQHRSEILGINGLLEYYQVIEGILFLVGNLVVTSGIYYKLSSSMPINTIY